MSAEARRRPGFPRMAVWKALLIVFPIALLTSSQWLPAALMGQLELLRIGAFAIAYLSFYTLFVLMLTTGRTHPFRSALFIAIAVALPLDFIPWMISTTGSMMLTEASLYSSGASFCPLTMPMVIIPALVKRIIIFPGELLPVAAHGAFTVMLIIWVGASLAIGRGWCSWGCFYGGWDEMFSRLRNKPVIPHKRIDRRWIFFPFALLLAIVLLSAVMLAPVYCEWLCPFKALTEFAAPVSLLTIIQMAIFIALFIGLVVVLPLLTRRRVQCGLFCPFGAMQSLFNKINIFEVRIDPAKCTQCQRCIRECPTFSLDESSLTSGKPSITCTRCAKCMDDCPAGAISFHIKGTSLTASPSVARGLFLVPAFFLMGLIGAGTVGQGLYRLLLLITTGRMY